MKRHALIILLAIAASSLAQGPAVDAKGDASVTVSSRGSDIRTVIHDLFTQLGRNYVVDSGVRSQSLFLSLKEVDFDEALAQICKLGDLKVEIQNGIYFLARAPKTAKPIESEKPKSEPKTENPPKQIEKPIQKPTTGTYPSSVLAKRVTTRFDKVDLRDLMAELGRQTGLKIEVDSKIPKYRIDAYLIDTSLKYALDQISAAANLRYRLTDRFSIEIVPNVAVSLETKSGTN